MQYITQFDAHNYPVFDCNVARKKYGWGNNETESYDLKIMDFSLIQKLLIGVNR